MEERTVRVKHNEVTQWPQSEGDIVGACRAPENRKNPSHTAMWANKTLTGSETLLATIRHLLSRCLFQFAWQNVFEASWNLKRIAKGPKCIPHV